jgi:CubicO group peptidase (beta-lactamase class C family)
MRFATLIISLILFCGNSVNSQVVGQYFPPLNPQAKWDTLSAEKLGWCTENIPVLYEQLERSNTKGYILLYKGRIVLEKYFGDFAKDSAWYWASAGKTLTSFLIGKAQEEKKLSIEDPTSKYLGIGWTAIPKEQEDMIKIKHQLTMTTGISDDVSDLDCTIDSCLQYKADPGLRWSYHNAPYTLLEDVLTKATGQTFNAYTQSTIKNRIGMTGLWVKSGPYNNVYVSTPRSMARFGHLMLNDGVWNGDTIMKDREYFNSMVTRSQVLNPSYGYLWWLNGQSGYMLPGFQFFFNGNLAKEAPEDVISGMGKNGQIVSYSKQHELVMIRMGQAPDSLGFVPNFFMSDIWKLTMDVACRATSVEETREALSSIVVHDNMVRFTNPEPGSRIMIYDMTGKKVHEQIDHAPIDISEYSSGVYALVISSKKGNYTEQIVKRQ